MYLTVGYVYLTVWENKNDLELMSSYKGMQPVEVQLGAFMLGIHAVPDLPTCTSHTCHLNIDTFETYLSAR